MKYWVCKENWVLRTTEARGRIPSWRHLIQDREDMVEEAKSQTMSSSLPPCFSLPSTPGHVCFVSFHYTDKCVFECRWAKWGFSKSVASQSPACTVCVQCWEACSEHFLNAESKTIKSTILIKTVWIHLIVTNIAFYLLPTLVSTFGLSVTVK